MKKGQPNTDESTPEIRPLGIADGPDLAGFLRALVLAGGNRFFHPHPLDETTAMAVCGNPGKDYYCGAFEENRMVAYGMLRGWNEGFAFPSLGLAVHPSECGKGRGQRILQHLHQVARDRGCGKIRLTVYRENLTAVRLFAQAGYRLVSNDESRSVGWLDLTTNSLSAIP